MYDRRSSVLFPDAVVDSDVILYRHGCWAYTADGRSLLDFNSQSSGGAFGHHNARLDAVAIAASCVYEERGEQASVDAQDGLSRILCQATFADQSIICSGVASARNLAIDAAIALFRKRSPASDIHIIRFSPSEGACKVGKRAGVTRKLSRAALNGTGHVDAKIRQVNGGFEILEKSINCGTAAILVDCMECGCERPQLTVEQLSELRDLCDFYNLQLIFDEGRIGIGRSGHVFAYEPMGVVPDALVTGREVGGPFKIGFCLMTNEASQGVSLCRDSKRTVARASIKSIAYASSTIAMMTERAFATHVRSMSRRITTRLKRLALRFPLIVRNTRCVGLKFEIECFSESRELHLLMKEEGLLSAISQSGKIILTPPLVIIATEVDEGIGRINRALTRLKKSRGLSAAV